MTVIIKKLNNYWSKNLFGLVLGICEILKASVDFGIYIDMYIKYT